MATFTIIDAFRAIPLTEAERKLLTRMHDEEIELDRFYPGGWWLGYQKIKSATPKKLIEKVYISRSSDSDESVEHYYINSDGKKAVGR